MTPNHQQRLARQDVNERQRFLNLARQVSETIGNQFFSLLVKELGGVLGAQCVYIGEFVVGGSERVKTLAACVEGAQVGAFEFPLEGSADAELRLGHPCLYARGAREAFPGDRRFAICRPMRTSASP